MASSKNYAPEKWSVAVDDESGEKFAAMTAEDGSSIPLGPGIYIDVSRQAVAPYTVHFTGNSTYFECIEGNQAGGKYTVTPTLMTLIDAGASSVKNVITKATVDLASINVRIKLYIELPALSETDLTFQVIGYDLEGAVTPLTSTKVVHNIPVAALSPDPELFFEFDIGRVPKGFAFYIGASSSADDTVEVVFDPAAIALTGFPEFCGRD